MLIQAALGDAYGAGFEFRDAAFIQQHNTLEAYYAHELFPETLMKTSSSPKSSRQICINNVFFGNTQVPKFITNW